MYPHFNQGKIEDKNINYYLQISFCIIQTVTLKFKKTAATWRATTRSFITWLKFPASTGVSELMRHGVPDTGIIYPNVNHFTFCNIEQHLPFGSVILHNLMRFESPWTVGCHLQTSPPMCAKLLWYTEYTAHSTTCCITPVSCFGFEWWVIWNRVVNFWQRPGN